MLRLSSPPEEGADILGALAGSGRRTIFILQDLVVEGLGHADGATREVGVVVQALPHGDACRGVTVARQQGKNVVLSAVPGLHNVAGVRGKSTSIGSAGSLSVAEALAVTRPSVLKFKAA